MTVNDKDSKLSSREKIQRLKVKHDPAFAILGIESPIFAPKMCFYPEGKDKSHIAFFLSEINQGQNVYTELVGKDYQEEDPDRTLWVWEYNPEWATQYQYIEGEIPAKRRYLIPVSELKKVRIDYEGVQETLFKEENNNKGELMHYDLKEDDCPMSEMTLRDYAAIKLNKPVSKKEWLNKVITSRL